MIKRARQDLSMERIQKLGEEHRKLVNEFLNSHPVSEETRFIKICQNTPQLCWGDEWPTLSPGGRGLG